MPTYRLLTFEELTELEKEFVEYLVLNGITAEDWVKMKAEDKDGAEQIIELFSDVVFEGIMRNVMYLEYRAENFVHAFQCLTDKLVLVAMESEDDSAVNFLDSAFIEASAINPPDKLIVRTTSKSYSKTRERELFDMIQAGCTISDGGLFKALCLKL
ncbi:DUF6495 family protein [Cytophaga aurantiaca]|uniref:DUF6495 family protein n=1 Tax=Cytophaga aurantiaca TaxID=29530 RepID=UPI0003709D97|nr:DUF6495 family protein [Cytophaga aurantiaca]